MTDLLKETNNQGDNDLPEEVFAKISRSISQAQCVIIEGSEVSLSLGYILTKSISLGKPVLLLRHKESNLKKSRFAESIKSKLLKVSLYSNNKELVDSLAWFFNQNKHVKTRFNLVMANEIDSIGGNRLLNTSVDELVAYFKEKCQLQAPKLLEDQISVDQKRI